MTFHKMRYRLALDLGTSSIGWAMLRLNQENEPTAIIKAGVRIFSDGRNPKDGSSLAVNRRLARGMRRRRDRLLKRKARMLKQLVENGFFPAAEIERKALELLDPFELRSRGLDQQLTPAEFGRALFHMTQRRGFQSNRKTDKKDTDSGALKTAIRGVRLAMSETNSRTVGEWLYKRKTAGETVRARYRERRETKEGIKPTVEKFYDLYLDRSMISDEFDTLWANQAKYDAVQFNDIARESLRDTLLFQRPLRPVRPGRCTLIPAEERAPSALPSSQRFRIYQEVNNLRLLAEGMKEITLSLAQRDTVVAALEKNGKRSFDQIRRLLNLGSDIHFNIEDPKRSELKGNSTSAILSKEKFFGEAWHDLDLSTQDKIVKKLIFEESTSDLICWLKSTFKSADSNASNIVETSLPEGYGNLSETALSWVLPELRSEVVSYAEAVKRCGDHGAPFNHHSVLSHAQSTGEILSKLPYYGEILQRHIGFADPNATESSSPEKRYGRIANPTVHIGLNQIRVVVNSILAKYGHPSEIIVEVARDLKQSKDQRDEESRRQAERQKKNARWREEIAAILNVIPERVKTADLQKLQLWEELASNVIDRRCPYSGQQISINMLFSDEVEIEHILPFSTTLDDSLNNKTVALRVANRVKGNATPWDAFGKSPRAGFEYSAILERARLMPKAKRYRFAEDGYQRWLREDSGFLARALNDTRYLSRIAREYVSAICPSGTRVIPGQMTAMLRAKFGLNDILGLYGEKNRDDHRHHAVDACVIGITDQRMLQRFASASASARERSLGRLVETMPLPWPRYREQVERAIQALWVSHRPDHGYQGAMHNETAYGLLGNGKVRFNKLVDGKRSPIEKNLKVIPFTSPKMAARHGVLEDGSPRPYKGYDGDSNYCVEIYREEAGGWASEVVSTFTAYQTVLALGEASLRNSQSARNGRPLVMRLMVNDPIRMMIDGKLRTMRVVSLSQNGQVFFADHQEANVASRSRNKTDPFSLTSKYAGSLKKANGRKVSINPLGEVYDPGFID